MAKRACPACGRPRGTSAACLSCREAAARELAREARDVTPEPSPGGAGTFQGFLRRPPWYARAAPKGRMERLRLLFMVLHDVADGSYRAIPWKAVVAALSAWAYVISPVELFPDLKVKDAGADDLLLVALLKRELRDYCAWKGLSPAHFGL